MLEVTVKVSVSLAHFFRAAQKYRLITPISREREYLSLFARLNEAQLNSFLVALYDSC